MTKPVALVTGATSGIGREGALWLARDGFHVICGGRNAERGNAVVAAIEAEGGSAEFTAFDITSEPDWARVTDAIAAQHGRLDALVNCGGALPLPPNWLTIWHSVTVIRPSETAKPSSGTSSSTATSPMRISPAKGWVRA